MYFLGPNLLYLRYSSVPGTAKNDKFGKERHPAKLLIYKVNQQKPKYGYCTQPGLGTGHNRFAPPLRNPHKYRVYLPLNTALKSPQVQCQVQFKITRHSLTGC